MDQDLRQPASERPRRRNRRGEEFRPDQEEEIQRLIAQGQNAMQELADVIAALTGMLSG